MIKRSLTKAEGLRSSQNTDAKPPASSLSVSKSVAKATSLGNPLPSHVYSQIEAVNLSALQGNCDNSTNDDVSNYLTLSSKHISLQTCAQSSQSDKIKLILDSGAFPHMLNIS